MEVFYVLSVLIMFTLFLLQKKSERKENIFLWIIINIVVVLMYNVFISILITSLKFKSSLLNLFISNLITSGLILFKIIKIDKKSIQKYYIKKSDIIFAIILFFIIAVVALIQYGFPFEIKYETTDPAIHFLYAKNYYISQQTPAQDCEEVMPLAYTNTGILFTIFSKYINEIDFYIIYIMFDLFILYLTGFAFYLSINKENNIMKIIITEILSILFVLGYPLNSIIFGYAYLSIALLILILLIIFAKFIRKENEINNFNYNMILSTLMYSLFFSYYMFVPVVYTSFGIYMLIEFLKQRKGKSIFSIITISNCIKIFIGLIIPTILGFVYFVLPGILNDTGTALNGIAWEGYIYRDLYSSFIFLIPFILLYFIKKIKEKDFNYILIFTTITIIFTLFLFVFGIKGNVSSYYFFKMYFVIWIILFYGTASIVNEIKERNFNVFIYICVIIYICVLGASLLDFDQKIINKNILFNPSPTLTSYTNIYKFNYNKIREDKKIYTREQLDSIKYILTIEENKNNIYFYGDTLQKLWANSLCRLANTEDIGALQIEEKFDIENWLNDQQKYLLCFNAGQEIDNNSKSYETILVKKDIIILKKINE